MPSLCFLFPKYPNFMASDPYFTILPFPCGCASANFTPSTTVFAFQESLPLLHSCLKNSQILFYAQFFYYVIYIFFFTTKFVGCVLRFSGAFLFFIPTSFLRFCFQLCTSTYWYYFPPTRFLCLFSLVDCILFHHAFFF